MILNIVETKGFTSCCGIPPSPANFSINNIIKTVKNLGINFKDAGKRLKEFSEFLRQLEKKEFEECREDEKEEQKYLEIEPVFLCCQKEDWDEMSYNHFDQDSLDFSYNEYSDGDWNLE